MKILFYCDTVFGYGGVERVLSVIAKAMTEHHDVTILSTDMRADTAIYGMAKDLFDDSKTNLFSETRKYMIWPIK